MSAQIKRIHVMPLIAFTLSVATASASDLAKVNGKVITDRDVKTSLAGFNETQRRQILNDSNSRREIVGSLIEQELLIQEAEKEKLDQDADYKDALNAFRRQFLSQKIIQKNVVTKITDSAAKKFFDLNKRKFSTDRVQVQHILLNDEKTALEMMKLAKAPGADFQALAEKNSKDPSAKNNRGDVGIITRDSMFVAEFKEAAFEGKPGEIVGPVKTLYGYHVIKIVDKKIGKALGYDEVESKVKTDLKQEMVQNYVNTLRKAASVSTDDKAISKL